MPCSIKQSVNFNTIQSQISGNILQFHTAVNLKLDLMMMVFGLHRGGTLNVEMLVLCFWQMQVESNCWAKESHLLLKMASLKGQ